MYSELPEQFNIKTQNTSAQYYLDTFFDISDLMYFTLIATKIFFSSSSQMSVKYNLVHFQFILIS